MKRISRAGGGGRDEDVEPGDAVDEVGARVFPGEEGHLAAEDVFPGREAVEPEVERVADLLDEPAAQGRVGELPRGQYQRVADVVEHAAYRDEGVLHVGNGGVGGGAVAPDGHLAGKVEPGDDALPVEVGGLGGGEGQFPARVGQAVAEHPAVGRRPVGHALVVGVAAGDRGGQMHGAVLDGVAEDRRAEEDLQGRVGEVVVLHPCRDVGIFGHAGRDIDKAGRLEVAVDVRGLRADDHGHRRVVGEAGGQKLAGDQPEAGKDFLHQFQPGAASGGSVDAADDVGLRDLGDVGLGRGFALCGRGVLRRVKDVDADDGGHPVARQVDAGGLVQREAGFVLAGRAELGREFRH